MKKRVVVGMSGGVDSSVAACLLVEQGYDVIGIMMKLFCDNCDSEDARRVCDKLSIPFYLMDFKQEFKNKVIDYFVAEYFCGKTPNPCIVCNKEIKFGALLDKAKEFGADYIATGHYAKVFYDEALDRYLIKKSDSINKDQTYALYKLTQTQLAHVLMPLCYYKKDEVREIAKSYELPVFNKSESQEICFIPDNDYARFLKERRGESIKEGNFINTKGEILGRHKGIIHYTVGQRKGFGIAFGKPMYVLEIIPDKNLVVLGEAHEIFKTELIAVNTNFIPFDRLTNEMNIKAKIRYSAKESAAKLIPIDDNSCRVIFETPQRAITPGQAVVFFDGDILIGGGTITV